MTAPFKVGEFAILQNCVYPENNGEECEIIGPLQMRKSIELGVIMAYEIQYRKGIAVTSPHMLRRRKPPTTGEASILAMFLTSPQKKGVTA